MIIEARQDRLIDVPSGWSRDAVLEVTIGSQYPVLAIIISRNVVLYTVVDDSGIVSHLPAGVFVVVDKKIPASWIANTIDPHADLVIGPPEIAKDAKAYEEIMEYEFEAVESLKKANGA